MNRLSRVYTLLSQLLAVFAIVSIPMVSRSATTVAPPVFSLTQGAYFGPQTVTITDATGGSTIYYTVTSGATGTTPTTASAQYTGTAITVGATETLEAIATAPGDAQSTASTATYTITTAPGTLTVYLSPPGTQATEVGGAITETFNELTASNCTSSATHQTTPVSSALGTYTGSSTSPYAICTYNQYGGATETNYFAVGTESGSVNPVTLTFAQPVSYFGFWWSAGDPDNRVALYSGNSLYGTFSTADLLSFLNSGNISNPTAYNGNPNPISGGNDSTEPFAYVSFFITGATITSIEFYNTSTSTGFESDNHSVIFNGNTVSIPADYVLVETKTLGSQVAAPVFTPSYAIPMTVTISSSTPGASISYATGSTQPTTTGTACNSNTSPNCLVTVSATETINAIAYASGMTNSSMVSATYTIPTLTLTSSGSPSTYGSPVTFTATISSGPTGTVTFYDSGTSIGTGTISGATATLTTSALAVGVHSITAGWTGSGGYGSVLSTAINQTVNPVTPTLSFSSIPSMPYGAAPFTVSASSVSTGAVTYSVTSGPATISGSTVTITGVGTVVLGASQAATTNYTAATASTSFTVSAAVPTVSVWPTASSITYGQTLASSTLTGGTASVAGSFSWTAPTTAPGAGTDSESVTFSPTDMTDYSTVTGTVTVQVNQATQCISNGYTYQRTIVIDHTKVPNTDQTNFPFLFSTTDPFLATTVNGGHVTSSAGNDIIFTSDSAGQNILSHELEEYNPATGQVIAWVRVPTLSHTTDTVLYMFYGNANITASQQNPSGVWDSNYEGVWHLPNRTALSTSDSTANGNNGTNYGAAAVAGEIDGAASFNGSSYIGIGDLGIFPTQGTIDFWMQPSSLSSYPNAFTTNYAGGNNAIRFEEDSSGDFGVAIGNGGFNGYALSTGGLNPNTWYHIALTWNTATSSATGYVSGTPVFNSNSSNLWPSTLQNVAIGSGYNTGRNWNGIIDEVRISNIARTADWVTTEYSNQSSPSTFYSLYSENTVAVIPATVNLYASQSYQFTFAGLCSAAITWSMPSGALGTLSGSGLYTAPPSISTVQTVAITATSEADPSLVASATITLLPLVAVSLTPANTTLYGGQTQQFTATVNNATNTAVTWAISPTGLGMISQTGLYTAPSINYQSAGFNAGSLILNGNAIVTSDGLLQITDGGDWEDSSAWYSAALSIQSFATDFTFEMLNAQADGITFTIQGLGTDALGADGGNLGYTGITNSVAVKFDIFNNEGEGNDSTGLYINGAVPMVPAIDLTSTGLELNSGDLIDAKLAYDGINLSMKLTDTVTNATAMEVFSVDIPGIIGSNSAYVGFTGATGSAASTQKILSWAFESNVRETLQVKATSVFDPAASASAVITLLPPVAVSATPANAVLYGGQSQQFTANVSNASNTSALWTISPAAGAGTLSATGLYTAPASITTQQTVTITVTSAANPASSATMTVTLVPYVSMSMTPTSAVLYGGQSQQFTAIVTDNTNTAVTWTLSPAAGSLLTSGFGTLSPTGLYAAPASISTQQTVIITATSAANSTVIATAVVSLMPAASENEIGISISAQSVVALLSPLTLTGTVTDTNGTPTITWSQVSGPGTVSFGTPQQAITTASFSQTGNYILQLSAADGSGNSGYLNWPVTVNFSGTDSGWVASPVNGSMVSGLVPITIASGVTIQPGGSLTYYPAIGSTIPNNITPLPITAASGTIATLDTTRLANGSYWIVLHATDTTGESQYNVVRVTVIGNNKPGRVTATVTDLVVPSTGLAINIQRSYDSLNAGASSDFGYGWSLGINVNLVVDPANNVTFTLGGQRKTFDFTPQMPACSLVGCLFPYQFSGYTPEPGLHGSLSSFDPNCPLGTVVSSGSLWVCQDTNEIFNPTSYAYTDPNGTVYSMSPTGGLQSIQDLSGNGLTITANGITSTTGLNVPFVRDAQNRITKITDPQGNVYQYSYDANGNLSTVTYPVTQSTLACPNTTASGVSTYTYDPTFIHLYAGGTDGRGCPLPTSNYYNSTNDGGNSSLDGRLASVQDALGETTSYAYNLAANTTTIIYPDDASGNPDRATMVYDNYGMLLSSTDPNGFTTTNTYDVNHNLITVTDPLGNKSTYTYDGNGNKTSSTYPATPTAANPTPNTTSYTAYNQYSEPTQTTDELGNVRTFNYDGNFLPQSVTDASGTLASFIFNSNSTLAAGAIGSDISVNPALASQFNYDAYGNMTSRTDALGRTTTYVYNALGQKASMTLPAVSSSTSTTTSYTYDALGNLTQTAAPLNRTTNSTYDSNGNKLTDTDARGNVTSYKYDPLNRLVETDYPDSTKSTKSYDFRNNVIDETDQAGNVTHHEYDVAGRQVEVIRGYGSTTTTPSITKYTYDNDGRKATETDVLNNVTLMGNVTTYTYDNNGHLTSTTGVAGNMTYAYDNAGNQISITDGKGNTTQFQYDARKRLIKTIYPDNTTKINAYDGPGNLISVTDQAGNVVQYTYDAANQLKTVVQVNHPNPANNTNSYSEDVLGNITGLTDENLHTTLKSFDLYNEPVSKTLPDQTLTETRQYDQAGNLQTLTHFNGVTTSYTYDALNRLLSRTTPGESPVSFTYTATGQRATMMDMSGTTSYSYDAQDRLTQKAAPAGTLSYSYDGAGNLASISSNHANGISLSYAYDSLNRLSSVVDSRLPSGANTTSYSYDPASNVATVTLPNGLTSTFSYDTLNRLTGLSSPIASYTYQLGPTGNRLNATESNGRSITWNYDGIYRLTNETISNDPSNNNGSVAYGLDPVGNRLSETTALSGLDPGSFTYNADDELANETYDTNGNTLATGGKTFTYDSQNRMLSMNGTVLTLVYDGDGNRVAKTVNGVTTQYLIVDLNPTGYAQVVEEVVNGATTRQYSYGPQLISEDQIIANVWTPSFYGYDGAGSVRQLTNLEGTVTDTYEYDAFGNGYDISDIAPNNYLYRGEQFDADLGLYYLRARYYNPLTGRFLSKDPEEGFTTDPKTLHKYDYAGGDPVNLFDPTGRAAGTLTWPGTGKVSNAGGIEYGMILQVTLATTTVAAAVVDAYLICKVGQDIELLAGIDAGPLSEIKSITYPTSCTAEVKRKCHPGIVYRIYGGRSRLWGDYWTYTDPGSVSNWFIAAGVGSWNSGTNIALGDLVNPEGCECGPAEPATDTDGTLIPGGGTDQVVCPNPQTHITLIATGSTAKGWGGK